MTNSDSSSAIRQVAAVALDPLDETRGRPARAAPSFYILSRFAPAASRPTREVTASEPSAVTSLAGGRRGPLYRH